MSAERRAPGRVPEVSFPGRRSTKTVCNIVGAIALLTFVGGPLSAQEKIKEGAEKTKHAVVKGAKATTEATKVNRLTVGSKRKD